MKEEHMDDVEKLNDMMARYEEKVKIQQDIVAKYKKILGGAEMRLAYWRNINSYILSAKNAIKTEMVRSKEDEESGGMI